LPARHLRDLCGRVARVDLKGDVVVPKDAVEW
jgi:hypothetical protein